MKKSLFLLAALPLLAGCAHDRMGDHASYDRHAVDQPSENRAVRDATDLQSDDRVYQRELQDNNTGNRDGYRRPSALEQEFPAAADQLDSFPDNYSRDGLNAWHRQRYMRNVW